MSSDSRPIIPYGRQTISEEDITAVVEVLRGRFLTQGPSVPAFEQALSSKLGSRHAVVVNSATSALHIACIALGLGEGDYLWTSPITFVASANCGRYCGAFVDFVDIDCNTGLMCLQALSSKLELAEREGTLPKVVVPVHLAGSSCDMKAIASLADRYGFSVLEDASHAIGGQYNGETVGNCRYSSITVFSFHPVKIITTGEGGLATTNSPELYQRMVELRSHGIVRETCRFKNQAMGPWVYEQQYLGYNYRMTDIQAALGLSQLHRLDEIVCERNKQLNHYRDILADLPVKLLDVPSGILTSGHLAVIRLEKNFINRHQQVFNGMRSSGIGVQLHYIPVHLHPYYRTLGFGEGQFPIAEAYAKSVMSLPLFPGLSRADQRYVSTVLAEHLLPLPEAILS